MRQPTVVTASTSNETQGLPARALWRCQLVRRLSGRQWPPDAKPKLRTPHAPFPRPRSPIATAQLPPHHQHGGAEKDFDCRARASVVACWQDRRRQAWWRAPSSHRPLAEGGRRGATEWRAYTNDVDVPATPFAGADTRGNRRPEPAARSAPKAAASPAAYCSLPNFGRSRQEQLCRTDARQPSIRPDTASQPIRSCADCRLFLSGSARIGKSAIHGFRRLSTVSDRPRDYAHSKQ